MISDFRYAFRSLRKSPGFTAVAVATLALGIGANTAIFSVADALLWKTVALPDVDRLMVVLEGETASPENWQQAALANFADWKRLSRSFESLAGFMSGSANVVPPGGYAERVQEFLVTPDFFATIGAKPAAGRTFSADDAPGSVVVLGSGFWRRRMGGDPAAVGQALLLDGRRHTVIGIMHDGFAFPRGAEIWTLIPPAGPSGPSRIARMMVPVGRLRAGVQPEQAAAEMRIIAAQIEREHPREMKGRTAMVLSLHRYLIGKLTSEYTWLMLGAAAFVLLIACANVANLQFARSAGRLRELAVRSALGAGRWRLVRQLLAENLVLAFAGAGLGLLLGIWGVDLIKSSMPAAVARYLAGWDRLAVDTRALLFTAAAAAAAGLAAGIAPAWTASRPAPGEMLKEGARGSAGGRRGSRLRALLVVGENALAIMLLLGAGLMVKGFASLLDESRAAAPQQVLALRLALNDPRYGEPRRRAAFYEELMRRAAALPGVEAAAVVTALPGSGHSSGRGLAIEGRPVADGLPLSAQFQAVSSDYFKLLRIPLVSGRYFDGRDGFDAQPAAVVSREMARRHWPGEDPLGKRLRLIAPGPEEPWLTVVGVAGGVRHDTYDRDFRSTVYVPAAQSPLRMTDVAVRVAGDPLALAPALREHLREMDPELPLYDVKTWETMIAEQATGLRYVTVLMAVFGLLALVLSMVGIYAVTAYSVAERTHEIGLRMALGADRSEVVGMVVRRGMWTAAIGLGIGLVMAFALARVLSGLVFGVAATDPATFGAVSLALAMVAWAACYMPARRAAAVDPIVALRHE